MGRAGRWGAVALGLVISASGLVGIVHVEGQALLHRDAVKQAKVAVVVPVAVPEVAIAEPTPTAVVAPVLVRVPGFFGLRLSRATARAEAQGLRVRFVDSAGNAVAPDGGAFYRVVRQSVRRRAEVEKTTEIELVVRERVASYSDWG